MIDFLNSNPALTSFIILILSSFIIFFGWKVLYANAKKIASRNETFNLISTCLQKVDKLVLESSYFWTSKDDYSLILLPKKLELEIVSLKHSLKQLMLRGIECNLDLEIRKLRRAITLDSNTKESVHNSIIQLKIEDIYFYSDELRNKLVLAFQNKHLKD